MQEYIKQTKTGSRKYKSFVRADFLVEMTGRVCYHIDIIFKKEIVMIWEDKYRLGVAEIDKQHMELFRRVNDFVVTLRSKGSWQEKVDKVNDTLQFMQEYVVIHFKAEEAYQLKIGYTGYEHHKKLHDDMVAYVTEVAEEYEREGYKEELIQRFAGKLLAWLINHVVAEDLKIAQYTIHKEEQK